MVRSRESGCSSIQHGKLPELVACSEDMRRLGSLMDAVGKRSCTVLIQGESGTGKELVARRVHAASSRSEGPFIPVDCTTLQGSLFESQLFGHAKGAFTGADQATLGFFRAADGGTLFLDEIGELRPRAQAKLLRCIQDRAVVPVGEVEAIPVDVRIIVATHRDVTEMVRRGDFREDLYYRLDVVRLHVPPLRARRDDVLPLAEWFIAQQARLYQEPVKTLSPEAIAALKAYDWPGNVRELANVIEHAYVLSNGGSLGVADLPDAFRIEVRTSRSPDINAVVPLEVAERSLIERALRVSEGRQALAARLLQIERRRLYRKVRLYGLQSLVRQRLS